MALGAFLFWRTLSKETSARQIINLDTLSTQSRTKKNRVLYSISTTAFLAGLICFLFDMEIMAKQNFLIKLPLYSIVGVGLSFAIIFTCLDLLNIFFSWIQQTNAKSLIETDEQILAVLYNCVAMGFIFGFCFGILDVEDQQSRYLMNAITRDLRVTIPFGFVLGALGGVYNELLRRNKVSPIDEAQGIMKEFRGVE